jgi:hypothetical protein
MNLGLDTQTPARHQSEFSYLTWSAQSPNSSASGHLLFAPEKKAPSTILR